MMSPKNVIARIVLLIVYRVTAVFSKITGRRGKKKFTNSGYLCVIGTFHNPNWFFSHILPLANCDCGKVVLICDEQVSEVDNVIYECPPGWLSKILSRAGAKLVWSIRCGFKYKPDLYMGYHIFPAAVTALIAARVFNRPACYQDTSGPLELAGGGWAAENPLLVALGQPSKMIEKAVFAVVREFDLVVVRGRGAEQYILEAGYTRNLMIITGSVRDDSDCLSLDSRPFDLVFVGRLTEYKQPDRFLEVAHHLKRDIEGIRVAVIGDGPDAGMLNELARELNIAENVEFFGRINNVEEIVSKSKVFILTSRWEGLSIAMIEAMSVGTVPSVTDVGDLKDLARDQVCGCVVGFDDYLQMVPCILELLKNNNKWNEYSAIARRDALAMSGRSSIIEKWNKGLRALIE